MYPWAVLFTRLLPAQHQLYDNIIHAECHTWRELNWAATPKTETNALSFSDDSWTSFWPIMKAGMNRKYVASARITFSWEASSKLTWRCKAMFVMLISCKTSLGNSTGEISQKGRPFKYLALTLNISLIETGSFLSDINAQVKGSLLSFVSVDTLSQKPTDMFSSSPILIGTSICVVSANTVFVRIVDSLGSNLRLVVFRTFTYDEIGDHWDEDEN